MTVYQGNEAAFDVRGRLSPDTTWLFHLEAGALVRGKVRRAVEGYCWRHGLHCETRELKGLIESDFLFTITGCEGAVAEAQRDLAAWVEEYGH